MLNMAIVHLVLFLVVAEIIVLNLQEIGEFTTFLFALLWYSGLFLVVHLAIGLTWLCRHSHVLLLRWKYARERRRIQRKFKRRAKYAIKVYVAKHEK